MARENRQATADKTSGGSPGSPVPKVDGGSNGGSQGPMTAATATGAGGIANIGSTAAPGVGEGSGRDAASSSFRGEGEETSATGGIPFAELSPDQQAEVRGALSQGIADTERFAQGLASGDAAVAEAVRDWLGVDPRADADLRQSLIDSSMKALARLQAWADNPSGHVTFDASRGYHAEYRDGGVILGTGFFGPQGVGTTQAGTFIHEGLHGAGHGHGGAGDALTTLRSAGRIADQARTGNLPFERSPMTARSQNMRDARAVLRDPSRNTYVLEWAIQSIRTDPY